MSSYRMTMTRDLIQSFISRQRSATSLIKHHKTDGARTFLPLSVKFVDSSDDDGDDDVGDDEDGDDDGDDDDAYDLTKSRSKSLNYV